MTPYQFQRSWNFWKFPGPEEPCLQTGGGGLQRAVWSMSPACPPETVAKNDAPLGTCVLRLCPFAELLAVTVAPTSTAPEES